MSSPSSFSGASRPLRLAQIVSRFPMVTETFVLYELEAMEKLGVTVELYSLLREHPKVVHPEAEKWIRRAHYLPFLSPKILRAHWHFIRRDPGRYFRTVAEVLRGTCGCVRCFGAALAFLPKAVRFAYEMKEQGIQHVHAHFAYHSAVAALIVHRLSGIPFSFTARGSDVQSDAHMLKEKVEAADFVISVSEYNKDIILRKCGPGVGEKIHVIHGGVNVDRLSPRPKSGADRLLRILCVARFEEVKGHTYLVEACRLLKERGFPFECRLLGDGPLAPQIDDQIKQSGLSGEVLLLGARPYDEVIGQFSTADVVVLATAPTASGKREGIPNVLKEAMACGLPVVATASGGIPELVDEGCGILVRPRDAAAIADALQRLSDDPELCRDMGRAGREKVVRDFNLNLSTARRAELFFNSAQPAEQRQNMQAHQQHPRVGLGSREARTCQMVDEVKSYFDSGAWYQSSRYSIQIRSEVIQAFLRDYEFSSVLDIGCGDGSLSVPLLSSHRRVTFLDLSQKALALAKSRVPEKYVSSVEFRNEDIVSAEFDDLHDVVICVGTLAHVARPYDVLRKLVELTRYGGLLILQNTDCRHFRSGLLRLARKVADNKTYSLNSLADENVRGFLTANGLVLDRVYRYAIAPIGFQRIFSQQSLYRQACRIHGTPDRNTNTWLANEYIYSFRRQDKALETPVYRLEQPTSSAAQFSS